MGKIPRRKSSISRTLRHKSQCTKQMTSQMTLIRIVSAHSRCRVISSDRPRYGRAPRRIFRSPGITTACVQT